MSDELKTTIDERELAGGMLNRETGFRLLISGPDCPDQLANIIELLKGRLAYDCWLSEP